MARAVAARGGKNWKLKLKNQWKTEHPNETALESKGEEPPTKCRYHPRMRALLEIYSYQKSTKCSLGKCLSKAWSEKSAKILWLTCGSRGPHSRLCRRLLRHTLSNCLLIPTCVPFMQSSMSPCYRRTSSWQGTSREKLLKWDSIKRFGQQTVIYAVISIWYQFLISD